MREKYDVSSLRHMIHAAAPCPIDVKHKMIAWWGNASRRVLRRQRGWWHAGDGGGVAAETRDGGQAWPISEIAIFDDNGNRVEEPNVIGTVYMGMADRRLRVPRRQGEDEEEPHRQLLHRGRRRSD